VSTGGPDLFVICKSCGSEVSPYITECPYCGNRLRKRAPKIDREGRVTQRRRKRPPTPALPRLRRGEIPGIRAESHPYATITLVVLGLLGCLLWRTSVAHFAQIAVIGKPTGQWWRVVSATFIYNNTGYAFATLLAIALYGWLLERRHGPIAVIVLFLLAGVGGTALTAFVSTGAFVVVGGLGAALAMLIVWALPDVLTLRSGGEIDGDLLGTAAFALVLVLMPLAVDTASWVSAGVGIVVGLVVGLPLARSTLR
jgi:membrane associated rhomboid family serine protease